MRTRIQPIVWIMLVLALYPIVLAGCSNNDAPPKDPKLRAVWEQSQAKHDQRKAAGAL